jgi:hypothetical protein
LFASIGLFRDPSELNRRSLKKKLAESGLIQDPIIRIEIVNVAFSCLLPDLMVHSLHYSAPLNSEQHRAICEELSVVSVVGNYPCLYNALYRRTDSGPLEEIFASAGDLFDFSSKETCTILVKMLTRNKPNSQLALEMVSLYRHGSDRSMESSRFGFTSLFPDDAVAQYVKTIRSSRRRLKKKAALLCQQ